MATVVAVCNNKGGVGKTNVSCNLPAFLTLYQKTVLLVDFDHQANATYSLGFNSKLVPLSIYHALVGQISPIALVRTTALFGFDLLPSSQDLAGAEIELVGLQNREIKLAEILESFRPRYDYIFIDCPPSLGLLTVNALVAADEVLIPVQAEYLALEGLSQLLSTIELVRRNLGKDLRDLRALLTMHDRRSRICREVETNLRNNFPGYVFQTTIPRASVLAEAPKFGRTILHHAPESKATKAYRQLAEEFLKLHENSEKV